MDSELDLKRDENGWVAIDAEGRTSLKDVFAVGDVVSALHNIPNAISTAGTVIAAISKDLGIEVSQELAAKTESTAPNIGVGKGVVDDRRLLA